MRVSHYPEKQVLLLHYPLLLQLEWVPALRYPIPALEWMLPALRYPTLLLEWVLLALHYLPMLQLLWGPVLRCPGMELAV
jgi:hypothetical protein